MTGRGRLTALWPWEAGIVDILTDWIAMELSSGSCLDGENDAFGEGKMADVGVDIVEAIETSAV